MSYVADIKQLSSRAIAAHRESGRSIITACQVRGCLLRLSVYVKVEDTESLLGRLVNTWTNLLLKKEKKKHKVEQFKNKQNKKNTSHPDQPVIALFG